MFVPIRSRSLAQTQNFSKIWNRLFNEKYLTSENWQATKKKKKERKKGGGREKN